jgi:hypothetical protein
MKMAAKAEANMPEIKDDDDGPSMPLGNTNPFRIIASSLFDLMITFRHNNDVSSRFIEWCSRWGA